MKNILVAINLEENTTQIIDFSFQLASKIGEDLSFLYVQKLTVANANIDQSRIQESNLNELIDQVDRIAKRYPNVAFECDVDFGLVKDTILEYADEYDHDLIILGIHDQNKLFNMTGISYQLIKGATLPVILIPDSFTSQSIDHIIFSIEFEFDEVNYLFDIIDLCKQLDGHLTCLHVDTSQGKARPDKKIVTYQKLLEAFLQEGKLDLSIIDGKAQNSINLFAVENAADLVVMLKERKNWKTQFLKTTKEKRLAKNLDVPIMILSH